MHKVSADRSKAFLSDYAQIATSYSWADEMRRYLEKSDGNINICYETLDRHLGTAIENKTALRCISKTWPDDKNGVVDISYGELIVRTCQFAHGLVRLGIKKGDKVFALLPRISELYVSALGTLRMGAVFSPLFSAFGAEPIQTRIKIGQATVLISLASFYQKKIAPVRNELPGLKYIILINDLGDEFKKIPSVIDFQSFMKESSRDYFCEKTNADDRALIHFTSGTTGRPKGAEHVHGVVLYYKISGRMALDLRAEDIFWCTADPGWVTGTSYGIISPLANGLTLLVDEAEFQADRWYKILQTFKVTVWYTAPTALRMLMKAGNELAWEYDLTGVRFAASVGEPLNPEVVVWCKKNLDLSMHDNWWQTETGGIMISNYYSMDIKLGSMGKPLPGIEVCLVKRKENQSLEIVSTPFEKGEIAIKAGWPAMFRGYLGEEERYRKCFVGNWYLSGDLAYKDEDGYYWFVGRSDDVIKSAGHLIGPFEVESTLMEHAAVLEAAVIGKPDPVVGEIVKAFVALRDGFIPSEKLNLDILAFARKRLGVAVAPKEIAFIDSLPKTKSGKIMRRLLKARELGQPEGDTSTLEAMS
ncbi:MAG: acetate--CoA ligase [Parachlamydiaceae bacterium]